MGSTRVHLTQRCRHMTTISKKKTERCKEGRERGTVTEKDVGEGKRNREREERTFYWRLPALFRRVLILSRNEWKTAVPGDMWTSKEYSNWRIYTPKAIWILSIAFKFIYIFIYDIHDLHLRFTIVSKLSRLSREKIERIVKTFNFLPIFLSGFYSPSWRGKITFAMQLMLAFTRLNAR